MTKDFVELTADDGTVYRRCGSLPDLFANEDGEIIRIQNVPVQDNLAVRYRKTSLSARCLIMDAWFPGWDREATGIDAKDGNPKNMAVSNLMLTKGTRGRPTGGALRKQAHYYQAYRMLIRSDIKPKQATAVIAEEFGVSEEAVKQAITQFEK